MEAKLKSITGQIPWSLLLKATFFGAAWFVLPWWLFAVTALLLYFIPPFQSSRLLLPFLTVIFLSYVLTVSLLSAIFLALLLFFILGIKDLVFIERMSAFNLLVLMTFFVGWLYVFSILPAGLSGTGIAYLGLSSVIFFSLGCQFLKYGIERLSRNQVITLGIISLLLWEGGIIMLFLPLNFFYETAILFLFGMFFLEFMSHTPLERPSGGRLLTYFSFFFVVLTVLLASADFLI